MSPVARRLWQLVPGIYRSRDAELPGAPLQRFVEVLGSELERLQGSIRALGDDHFVERASADGLALLAELLGARTLQADLRANRGLVFNAVAWRRRRGTQPTLEDVLRITSGWSAEVDEAFRSLAHTQELRHLLPFRGRSAVLWDPIAAADPLSRQTPGVGLPRRAEQPRPQLEQRPGESFEQTLRRTGRADAGRHAVSPRNLDLLGWARPDVALIRSARFVAQELEDLELTRQVTVTTLAPERSLRGLHLDPLGRDVPLVWLEPLARPDAIPTLTAVHEPAPAPRPMRAAASLLTPTALAADGDRAEAAGALELSVDGVQLIGAPRLTAPGGALAFAPLGPSPVLRFADLLRPDPNDEWLLELLARQPGSDTSLAAARTLRGQAPALELAAAADTPLGGATLLLRVRRLAGTGARRDPDGNWSAAGDGTRLGPPLGAAIGIGSELLRPELHEASGDLRLARRGLADAAWSALALGGDVPAAEPGALLVDTAGGLLLVVPERDSSGKATGMGTYRIALDTGVVTRLVADAALRPPARRDASASVLAGRLYLHGGEASGAMLGDLWSIAIDGSESRWTPHPVRNPQPRRGASLFAGAGALWLVGGEVAAGQLANGVCSLDPGAARPRWLAHPPLPFEAGRPGVACARRTASGLEVIAWADATRPRRHLLPDGAGAWSSSAPEALAPNPPAPGECLFVADELVVVGPPPLPASEVIVTVGAESVLAFVPALDLVPAPLRVGEALLDDEALDPDVSPGGYATYHVGSDGSTWIAGAGDEPLHTRQGGALHASRVARSADRPRIGVPERLARHFFRLRQRSLGPWQEPLQIADRDVVGIDPRLGRVLLPAEVGAGRVRASYRVGRASAIGAGALPPSRNVPEHWQEPDLTTPIPPERREPAARALAWVDPRRAGSFASDGTQDVPIVADLGAALELVAQADAATAEAPWIGVLRSSTLPPARLERGLERGLSLVATDFGATPLLRASRPGGASLLLHPDRGGSRATALWLAGLWLEGSLEAALAVGELDLRWCTLGQPGQVGVRVPGAQHESPLTRRTLPAPELELRLYGCQVAALVVPPWVRVIAAGCTFDAGSREQPAIAASGADVRLRHCSVHGALTAGELRASSCALAGSVHVDRPDRGWVRHSLLPEGGRPPRSYRSLLGPVAFASSIPTHPNYLVLADTNGAAALGAGELGRSPGAHEDRGRRLRELELRSADFLPAGLEPHHADRTLHDLNRMSRPPRRTL